MNRMEFSDSMTKLSVFLDPSGGASFVVDATGCYGGTEQHALAPEDVKKLVAFLSGTEAAGERQQEKP